MSVSLSTTVRIGVYISKVRLAKIQPDVRRTIGSAISGTGHYSNHKNSHSDFSFHTRSAWPISALLASRELCLCPICMPAKMRSSKPGQANVQEGCAASRFSGRTNSDQATVQTPSLKYQASCAKSPSIVWRPSASAH